MNSEVVLENIKKTIINSKKILILCHESPDGDAIGSTLALYKALKSIKKDVDYILDEYSACFNFLEIKDYEYKKKTKYDLIIALDCASKDRIYDPYNYINTGTNLISIDHHVSNTYYANYNYVEGTSPAACQVLLKVLKKLEINITKEIAECLITGIITDTGGFNYDTVNEETFNFAAKALSLGVNVEEIYTKVFKTTTLQQFKLHKIAISRLELLEKNNISFTYITIKDQKKCKSNAGDHEGIVNIGEYIEGVKISIFLRETKEGYKVSLRSNTDIDVSEIAEAFNGGGHKKASGCLINKDLKTAKKLLIKEIKKQL